MNQAAAESTNEIERLKQDLGKIRQEAENNLAGWKRAKADYINLQRENEKARQNWINFSSLAVIKDWLPLWENFDLLIKKLPDNLDQPWVTGLKQLHKMMTDFLKRNGVERIKVEGEKFDPEWHEAVGKEKIVDVPPGQIIKEITPGYKMNNKLIIIPKVIVGE